MALLLNPVVLFSIAKAPTAPLKSVEGGVLVKEQRACSDSCVSASRCH